MLRDYSFPTCSANFGWQGTLLPLLLEGALGRLGCTLGVCLPDTHDLTAESKWEGRGPKSHTVTAVSVSSWLE